MTCLGLGFAIVVVLLDIIPDATEEFAALVSLLIPIGAVIPISESVTKPLMALSAGVILFGAIIAWVSCLMA